MIVFFTCLLNTFLKGVIFMKILMFDFRESEKTFFKKNKFCDFDITFYEEPLTEKTKLTEDELNNTTSLIIYRSSILTEKVLKKFKNLRVIATRSHGFSHIDIDYCTKNRIAVLNVEQYGEKAVAEYALGLIIMLIRNVKPAILDIYKHKINPKKYEGALLDKKTVGIVGCGKVGIQLGKIANFFDMRVLVSSYKDSPQFENFCNVVPFDNLLAESDIIYLHMPFITEMYKIIGEEEFKKMKDGVFIINTSGVELIDLQALLKNIKSGKVHGAALDILECDYSAKKSKDIGSETMSTENNHRVTAKLFAQPNVIITPHIAYNTVEYIDYVLESTINNLKNFQKGYNTNRLC